MFAETHVQIRYTIDGAYLVTLTFEGIYFTAI